MINRQIARTAIVVLAFAAAVRPINAQQVHVPRAVLERYVGEYVHPAGGTIRISVSGDTLFQEVPGRRSILVPISETLFKYGPVFTVEFVMDKAGGATQIATDGAGVEFRLRRKGSPPEPPREPIPAVPVARPVLEKYVGVYEYIPGQMGRTDLRVVIRLKGDTLVRDMGDEQILVPLSDTRFQVRNTSIAVEFVVDDAGVTQILGKGGQQMIARLQKKN